MKKYCFGIDIGGTTVKCGLFNVDGEVLDRRKRSGQRRDRRSRRWCTGTGR